MYRYLLIILVLFTTSCSKNPEDATREAIDIALSYLSDGECDEAIEVLRDAEDLENPTYLQVLASAYACKSNFDATAFLSGDIANLVTTNQFTIMTGIAKFSTSAETESDSVAFTSMRTGINLILDSTTGAPSQVSRDTEFGIRRSGDMGIQVMMMTIVNLGKFLHYYGNVDANGAKGAGTGTNNCFINYNDPRAQAATGISTGACVSDNDGHPDLDQSTDAGKRRLCEGLVLLTNTLDVLDNIDVSGSSDLAKLESIGTQVNNFRTAAVAAGLGTLIGMTSQSECEQHVSVPAQLLDMEYLYALVFDSGLQ